MKKIEIRELEGNGDFRSPECKRYLKEADIVITNPPFSLFREYVAQLMEYGKKFIVIGNQNACTDKEIFPLIKNNQLWIGVNHVKEFIQPNKELKKFGNICWYTNISNKRRNETLDLYKKYNEKEYPKYENYDAIEVSKVCEIPTDYKGIMGVPITILEHYNPTQFEIVGCADANIIPENWKGMSADFVEKYYAQGNTGAYKEGNRLTHYFDKNGKAKVPFKRVLVKCV